MEIGKKKIIFIILAFFLAIAVFGRWSLARAEDEDENEYYQEDVAKTIAPSVTSTKVQQTATASVETKTTILNDSDGDGLLDKDDPHPAIAEIYIVEDSNRNGIVDKFEK